MYERGVPFTFGVVYQTTPDQLEAIPCMVKSIIEDLGNTRFDRAHFKSFGESSYDFEVVYYVRSPDYNVYMDIKQKIKLALCRLTAAGTIGDFSGRTGTFPPCIPCQAPAAKVAPVWRGTFRRTRAGNISTCEKSAGRNAA